MLISYDSVSFVLFAGLVPGPNDVKITWKQYELHLKAIVAELNYSAQLHRALEGMKQDCFE